ncbi:MAG TPA: hypothetical protein VKB29_10690 [Candidatus Binataceae bacterium]|nr:hypothetical protein [Candidatus Binataceae bacterium]
MSDPIRKKGGRFTQLMKQLEDAIADGDIERESRIRIELDAIIAASGDDPEVVNARSRERRRIVAAINRSLEKIRKHDPKLARALATALKTRAFFSYSPESSELTEATNAASESQKRPRKV